MDKVDNLSWYASSYYKKFYCNNTWQRQGYKLNIQPFPNIFNNDKEIDSLFRKFTKNEVALIVNKISKTKTLTIFSFISKFLKRKMNLDVKDPFWFIPFVAYGNNLGSLFYFGQDGVYNCLKNPFELTNVCHVDLWQEVTVENGYNGLFEDNLDDKSVSTLKIKWYNPDSGNSGEINIVEFHGSKFGSSLRIVEALWNYAWKEVVDRSKGASEYLIGPPPNIEFFHNWDELIKWSSSEYYSEKEQSNIIGDIILLDKLEIAQFDMPETMRWDDAMNACLSLGYGWRLPNPKELNFIFKSKSKIDNLKGEFYWTSDEYDIDDNDVWYQDFNQGTQDFCKKHFLNSVRVVRLKNNKL